MTCVVPVTYEDAQSFTTLITRPKSEVVDSQFLCHFVNSGTGQAFFERSQIGGAQKNVNASTLRGMPVPVPPLSEQRAIATALNDMNGLIVALDGLIAKKRDLKQAAMQQLLTGQTRLPGFSGKWEQTFLGKLGRWFSGGTPRMNVDAYWSGDIPWISPKDMKVARLHDALDHVSEAALSNGTRLVPPGAILIGTVGRHIGELEIGMILLRYLAKASERGFARDIRQLRVLARDDLARRVAVEALDGAVGLLDVHLAALVGELVRLVVLPALEQVLDALCLAALAGLRIRGLGL